MSTRSLGLESYKEPECLPGNEEYKVQVTSAEWKSSDKGEYLMVGLRAIEHGNAKLITEIFSHPADAKDTPKMSKSDMENLRKGQIVRMQNALGEGADALNPETLIGREADVILKVETHDTYGDQNKVKTWIAKV